MALNNYEKADRIRTRVHQAISDVYFDLNGFAPHNALPDLMRAKGYLAEAYQTAKKIRDARQRNFMLSDLNNDQRQLWDAEDQFKAILSR